jgi:hypothetical protein
MTLKIKLWINGKGKKKMKWCAHDKKLFIFIFLSHRHAVLSRGTQRNRRKLSECSNPLENIILSVVSAWSDLSDQVGYFHRDTETWQHCQVGHI